MRALDVCLLTVGLTGCAAGGGSEAPTGGDSEPATTTPPPAPRPPEANGSVGNAEPFVDLGGDLVGTEQPVAMGCAKVDFLFVVDNSLSMLEEQRALIGSFPRFMSVVTEALGSDDFHVMVVDTDAGSLGDLLGSLLGGAPLDTGCEGQLGAGRRLRQDGAECVHASTGRCAREVFGLQPFSRA